GADPSTFCSPDQKRGYNINALALCAIYDRGVMADALLEAGADSMATQQSHGLEMSALAYAALYNRIELFRKMVARGADANQALAPSHSYHTNPPVSLLALAARHGGLEVVRYLVEEHGVS